MNSQAQKLRHVQTVIENALAAESTAQDWVTVQELDELFDCMHGGPEPSRPLSPEIAYWDKVLAEEIASLPPHIRERLLQEEQVS